MSRPLPPGEFLPLPDPVEQVRSLAAVNSGRVARESYERLVARTRELDLRFSDDELTVIAALDTPDKVQDFLDNQIYYNYDHPTLDHPVAQVEDSAMSPRRVLETGRAHCFEGACFAYAVNYLHGHDPRWVLIEASQDSDHNLIICRYPNGEYGVNAHSGYPNLVGNKKRFPSIRAIVESYFPFYFSDHTLDPNDVTMMGYSEPIDLVARFGTSWIASERDVWEIYFTYVDDSVRLHYIFDDSGATHLYPMIRALKCGWIETNGGGPPRVALDRLPPVARPLWTRFWQIFKPEEVRPHGRAHDLEMCFFGWTGTTPIDLQDNAEEYGFYVEKGYSADKILSRSG